MSKDDFLNKAKTVALMWDIAKENAELLHCPEDGRLQHRPDGKAWDAPGFFAELRIERYSYKAEDTRLALIAYALIRTEDGQVLNVEDSSGDYLATYMARSSSRPTFIRSQITSAAGRLISWGNYVARNKINLQ